MTTIAFDGRFIAVDSRTVKGDTVAQVSEGKLFIANDRYALAYCGDCAQALCWIQEFINFHRWEDNRRWWHTTRERVFNPPQYQSPRFTIWVFDRKGNRLFHLDGNQHFVLLESPTAAGSGAEVALGAMDHGANAMQAVDTASKYDLATGGDIYYIDVSLGSAMGWQINEYPHKRQGCELSKPYRSALDKEWDYTS